MKSIFYRQKKLKNGFTVLELMTAVVIIGILVAIFATNFIASSKKRANEAALITNVRTLQVMLETYRVDYESYPENLSELGNEASKEDKKYNKKATNPFTSLSGPVSTTNIWAIDITPLTDPGDPAFNKNFTIGRVGYKKESHTKYYLWAYGGDGIPIKRNGATYIVTNGEKN